MRQVVIDNNCLIQMISLHSPYRPIWNAFLILNRRNVTFVDPHFRLGLITQDPDDNKFVDCAFAANAEYIVSDDKHFKILERTPFPQLNLIRMAEFLPIVSQL